jgi:hypothetical protein
MNCPASVRDRWTEPMNRHSLRSPVVVTLETAPGHKSQYLIRDLYKAMAVMRWYKLKPLRDLRGLSPGIWLVTASAMARAHEHSDPGTIEHAQDMFAALAKAAGVLAGL